MVKAKKETINEQNKKARKIDKTIFTIITLVLLIAIILVSIFMLYPRVAGRPDWQTMLMLDFDDSTWVEEMVNRRVKPSGTVMDISSSFVYSTDTAFIQYTYASPTSINEAKEYFLNKIPGSVDLAEGVPSKLSIKGMINDEEIDVVNYEADLLNAYDLKVVIDRQKAEKIKSKLIAEYPTDFLKGYPEIAAVMKKEKLGGYVMYNDDELSNNSYAGAPIFSEAYRYGGTQEQLLAELKAIKEKYSSSVFFEDGQMAFFKDQGHIISLSIVESDLNILAVVSVQKIPEDAKTGIE